jgi:hypothetical protein
MDHKVQARLDKLVVAFNDTALHVSSSYDVSPNVYQVAHVVHLAEIDECSERRIASDPLACTTAQATSSVVK